jgi:hypothetical protein
VVSDQTFPKCDVDGTASAVTGTIADYDLPFPHTQAGNTVAATTKIIRLRVSLVRPNDQNRFSKKKDEKELI